MDPRIDRLVACFDGTWNTQRSNTNVSRLYRQIADPSTGCPAQRRFYDEGVGTSWGERLRGGAFGIGLDHNIRQGYAWLGAQFAQAAGGVSGGPFQAGPAIYLLGFSRGAFTARSLGGMIQYLGLPKLDAATRLADDAVEHPVIGEAWALYAERPADAEAAAVDQGTADAATRARVQAHRAELDRHRETKSIYPVSIHFIGVWDTVGALGIPRIFDRWSLGRPSTKYRFHNTRLGSNVRHACHAIAIDEHRAPYAVTLWQRPDAAKQPIVETLEQRWFPGAHADVGGGYEDSLLPDAPLAWLASRAADFGLHFLNDRREPDPATGEVPTSVARMPAMFDLDGSEHLGAVHDSYAEFGFGLYRLLRTLPGAGGRAYRRMLVDADGAGQQIDPTANRKVAADAGYRPPNLAQAGRSDVSFNQARADGGDAAGGATRT